ncbi:DUF3426 domain-containing protein [Caenimonas soli]|uniref:DUF3426 domain-containing protein n=1 Tax=Caenimonas soli TaxID=2735555 RepID=UPI00155701FB|nr:DUF3426 domain-containing protein [Caenimonas soli]NPC56111.1 DUF3426 domain-containing protein [Caenimonas soli]
MSLITRCPACGTMFKVVPDQLRISEGWVRCGHCADVFDAAAHLQPDDQEVAATESSPSLQPTVPASLAGPESEDFPPSVHSEIDESLLSEAPDSTQLYEEAQALRETPLDQPFELRRQDPGDAVPQPPVSVRAQLEPEPELHELSFVRQARREEFWQRRGVRATALVALTILGAMLALQVVLHDRDRLAASDPGLRPLLARLCQPLNCSVRSPRQIDSLAIDSSAFTKLAGDSYRLSVTLKNQASTEVAMPALELTLTDAQDQAVVRRVLMPTELGTHPGVIAAGSEWSGAVVLTVAANGAGARIAGYRLLAFYP